MSATPRIYELEYLEDDLDDGLEDDLDDGLEDGELDSEDEELDSLEDESGDEYSDYSEINSEESNNGFIDLGEVIYFMSFTDAIKNNYITDYRIYLPSVHETNADLIANINSEIELGLLDNELRAKCIYLFKCLVEKGSRKCIVYCENTDKLDKMITMMTELNSYYYLDLSMESITSSTNKKSRFRILETFASDNSINLLFSIRILDECIDIPSCDSVYITYETSCKIRTIQRICRAIRIDSTNKFKIANIFMWCSDYAKILETLSGIKEYDVLFKDKISVLAVDYKSEKKEKDNVDDDITKLKDYVIGIKEFRDYTWDEKLLETKKYIDKHGKRPSEHNKDIQIKQLATWISAQQQNYKKKEQIMKKDEIYNLWTIFLEEYKEYINLSSEYKPKEKSNDEIWHETFQSVKKFINENKRKPLQIDKDIQIKQLANWVSAQQSNYKKKEKIMKKDEIYNEWTIFLEEYKDYFKSDDEIWHETFQSVKIFIDENKKRPTMKSSNNNEKVLGKWLSHQITNYNKKEHGMKDFIKYNLWTEFTNDTKYKKYFLSNEEIWLNNLKQVQDYIDINNKRP
jgi:hypothetical protein